MASTFQSDLEKIKSWYNNNTKTFSQSKQIEINASLAVLADTIVQITALLEDSVEIQFYQLIQSLKQSRNKVSSSLSTLEIPLSWYKGGQISKSDLAQKFQIVELQRSVDKARMVININYAAVETIWNGAKTKLDKSVNGVLKLLDTNAPDIKNIQNWLFNDQLYLEDGSVYNINTTENLVNDLTKSLLDLTDSANTLNENMKSHLDKVKVDLFFFK